MHIPSALAATWRHERDWLDELPELVRNCAEKWDLDLEEPADTPHSLVIPAGEAVLKLNAPSHFEADREADALEAWQGKAAVRLVARDDERRALLIERCRPGMRLRDSGVDETQVVAGLLPRLQIEVAEPHCFTTLADEADRWA